MPGAEKRSRALSISSAAASSSEFCGEYSSLLPTLTGVAAPEAERFVGRPSIEAAAEGALRFGGMMDSKRISDFSPSS